MAGRPFFLFEGGGGGGGVWSKQESNLQILSS